MNGTNNHYLNAFKALPKGTAARVYHILAYHYDAIIREINQETKGETYFDDAIIELMEESQLAGLINDIEDQE